MIELVRALADALPEGTVRTRTRIQKLLRQGDLWKVVTETGESLEFDHVVVATPPAVAANLLDHVVDLAASELRQIQSASTAIVVLGVARDDIHRDIETFGFVVPASENRKILAASFASNKFAGRAPQGHVLIRVFIGGAMQSELLERSDDQLVELARDELDDLIGLGGEPVLKRVIRWNHAMPQYHVGHRQRVKRIEAAIDQVPGLTLINNALGGVGIAPLVEAADRAARGVQ